jgi:hypothetical protein
MSGDYKNDIIELLKNWKLAKSAAIIPQGKVATGIIQHPQTGNWQLWLSLYGNDFTWLGAYQDRAGAAAMLETFGELLSEGRLATPEAVEEFLTAVKETWEAQPTDVSEEIFVKIKAQIKKDWASRR